MVNFFKKLFTWDHPAQGLVFALALLLFGSWSVWSLSPFCWVMTENFTPLMMMARRMMKLLKRPCRNF